MSSSISTLRVKPHPRFCHRAPETNPPPGVCCCQAGAGEDSGEQQDTGEPLLLVTCGPKLAWGGGWWSWDPILGSLEALNLRCSVSGAGAGGPDLGAAGGGVPEEEPRDPAGPPDPLAQREHQHSDQRAGAEGEGGAEDPQRSQSADQVGPEAPGPGPGPAGLQGPVLLLPLKCSRLRLREHASCCRRCGFSHCSLATTGVNVGLDISQLASAWEVEPTFLEVLTSLAELKSQLAAV